MVKFIPYNNTLHRTQFFELNVELITWISEEMNKRHNIDSVSIIGQTIREYVETVFPHFTTISPPEGIIYVLQIQDELVGMGAIKKLEPGICEIKRMYICPKFRRRGFGKDLLWLLIEKAKEFNYSTLRLETGDYSTTAHHLYRSAGFKEIAEYPGVETPAWYRQYCLYMEKQLT